jgi:uncharacterized surface protein with fasciclin (FAS1) repeats
MAARCAAGGSVALCCALAACAPDPAAVAPVEPRPRIAPATEPPTVIAAISRVSEFAWLRRALTETGRIDALRTRQPVTLLAARDTAFARLGPDARAAAFDPANRAELARTIDLAIIPRAVRAEELRTLISDGGGSATLASRGGPLLFTLDGPLLVVTAPNGASASMGTQEIATGNGSVYVLDRWLGTPPP